MLRGCYSDLMKSTLELLEYWLKCIVIDLDLCPFARIPYQKKLIRLSECLDGSEQGQYEFFLAELDLLSETPKSEIATSIVSFVHGAKSFYDFYDFFGDIEAMLEEAGLSHIFQIVCFHPGFHFKGQHPNNPGNLVNRSPFPVIHIIRSEDFNKALMNPEDGEVISYNNNQKLMSMDQSEIEKLFYYLK